MPDITTSQIFTPGQTYTDVELNAIISGASITPSAITSRSQVSAFDPTGVYLLALAGALRKSTGQQIIDGVAASAGFIHGLTQKTPLVGADEVMVYDSVAAANKRALVSDLSLLALTRDLTFGSIYATVGTPGTGPVIPAAWNLANSSTGTMMTIGATFKAAMRLVILVQVTLTGVAGATTDVDFAVIRDDFAVMYQLNAAMRFNTTVGQKTVYNFIAVDPNTLGPTIHNYYVKMQQTAGTVNTIFDIRHLTLGFN